MTSQFPAWQDINTALKDRTIIIGRGGHNKIKYAMEAHWDSTFKRWEANYGLPCKPPTHWMPLPEPPE